MSDNPNQPTSTPKVDIPKPPAPRPDRDLITYIERDKKTRRTKSR